MLAVAETNVIPLDDFAQRKSDGLVVPLHAGTGLQVVDCGDRRELTQDAAAMRAAAYGSEVVPGRYFGGPSGLAVTGLIALAAQTGEATIANFVEQYSPEAFTDFAVDLSNRAYMQKDGLEIHHHSAAPNEGNDSELAAASDEEHEHPLGCKFLLLAGYILGKSTRDLAFESSKRVGSLAGHEMPLEEVREGAQILSRYFPATFAISRGMLHRSMATNPGHAPVTILEDSPVANSQTAVVIDLAGYRAHPARHAKAGIPRYHHTPGIAAELIPSLLPEYNLDPKLLEAAGALIGSATRDALSGEATPQDLKVEVIPPEYAAAA